MTRWSFLLLACSLGGCDEARTGSRPTGRDSLESPTALPASSGSPLREQRREDSRIHYAGDAHLSGRYQRRVDQGMLDSVGDQICFFADSASAPVIPRGPGDSRIAWFCFANRDEALRLLGTDLVPPTSCGLEGTATVAVSEYVADLAETSTFDTARLDSVVAATPPVPISCGGA